MACAETACLPKVGAFLSCTVQLGTALTHIIKDPTAVGTGIGSAAYGMAGCKRGGEKMVRAGPTARSSKLATHERRPHGETNASLSGLEEDRYPDR
jgi:hypothetical protein